MRHLLLSLVLTGLLGGGVAAQNRTNLSVPRLPGLPALPAAPKLPEGSVAPGSDAAKVPDLAAPAVPSAAPVAPAPAAPAASALPKGGRDGSLPLAASPIAPAAAAVPAAPAAPAAQSAQASVAAPSAAFDGLKYPATRRDDGVVDDYFGTKVADPYRWLEDDNSPETKAWVEAQNKVTESYLSQIPERGELVDRLKQLWNYERRYTPAKIGNYWIYEKNDGLQNQDVLYKAKSAKGKAEVLLDPNALSSDGTAALSGTSFSEDGKYMAYAVSRAGSDWTVWKIRDVETGQDLPDTIEWTKFTGASWTHDGQGFYYQRFPQPKPGEEMTGRNVDAKVYYHKVGTSQDQDVLAYERPDHPEWNFGTQITEDGRFLVLYQYEGTEPKNRVWIKDLAKRGSQFRPLFDKFDAQYSVVGNDGERFYVHTTKDAPRGKLVAVDLAYRHPARWKTFIAQAKGRDVLESVQREGNRFVAVWGTDAHQVLRVYGPRGGFKYEVALPGIGSVSGYSRAAKDDPKNGFFTFTSYNYPSSQFRLNLDTGKTSLFWKPKIPVDPTQFEVKQVFYPSKDGTKIPMFIVHKKGLKLDGTNPTYLYGYGGFSISLNPAFSGKTVAWLERGGVYAVANLRGGGEYGEEWHDAGRLKNKQNVFDDFIAAAEYLIRSGYTSTPKLAIGGGSNGGLLVGAAMTQRPDLFGAAIPQVGVMDMLRFHLFTVGRGWKSDYGSSETKEGFETLINYSPLQNLRPGTSYPATMVMTGDHDDRVFPAHSFKFAAELQHDQAGPAPALIRVEKNAGHGAGKPLAMLAQEAADMWAFLLRALGVSRGGASS